MGKPVTTAPRFDYIVRGGSVFDGTGSEPFSADIGIVGDRVSEIGDLSKADAGSCIQADGLRVAPGFIDIHTHSDISATYEKALDSTWPPGVWDLVRPFKYREAVSA